MYELDISGVVELENAIKKYKGNAEEVINDVLHGEGGELIKNSIRRLIPESGAKWKGKKGPAKSSNSLHNLNTNLAVTVTTTKSYQYLYFPNDGTNTRRHAGNKQFFAEGAENVKDEIIERCITRLTQEFN